MGLVRKRQQSLTTPKQSSVFSLNDWRGGGGIIGGLQFKLGTSKNTHIISSTSPLGSALK